MSSNLLYINITVHNNTGCPFNGVSTETKDGGFVTSPPSQVAAGGVASFKVQQTNHASSGPEGWTTWNVITGNDNPYWTEIYWMLSSGHNHDKSASVVSTDARLNGTFSWSAASGDSQNLSYTITYTPNAPNDWDMVWSLSVGALNTQLQYLTWLGVIPGSFTGTVDASTSLSVGSMTNPTVAVPDNQTTHLELHLPFGSATLHYVEGGAAKTQSLSGDTVILSLDLSVQPVSNAGGLKASSAAIAAVQSLLSQSYGVYRVFLDLTNPALCTGVRVVTTSSGAAVSLSSAAQSALQRSLAALGTLDVAYTVAAPGRPSALVPTRSIPRTTDDPSNDSHSSLNVCMMTRGRSEPEYNNRFVFSPPMASLTGSDGTTGQNLARLYISQDTLGECYLKPTVLPVFAGATAVYDESGALKVGAVPMTYTRTGPLCYTCGGTKDNSSQNDGRGQWVNVNNGFDQYVVVTERWSFTTSPNTSAVGTCTIALSGSLVVEAVASQYPLDFIGIGSQDKLGTATYTQPWTGTITIETGSLAQMKTTVSISLGTLSPDVDKTLDGWVFNGLDQLFGWTSTSPMAAISAKIQDYVSKLASAFQDSAGITLDASASLVLPTGAVEGYAAFGFNAAGSIQVDVSFPMPNI